MPNMASMTEAQRSQVGAYGMVLPAMFADDEAMVRAVLTNHAREAGHQVANDAPMRMKVVSDNLNPYETRLLADIEVTLTHA